MPLRSHLRLTASATVAPPRKPKTGGGGGGGGGGGNSKRGAGNAEDDRRKAANMLQRLYAQEPTTASALVLAMRRRWGQPHRCLVAEAGDCALTVHAVLVLPEALPPRDDRAELEQVVELLNTCGIGAQFVEHIKYGSSLGRPDAPGGLLVPLNVPTLGPRAAEWLL